VPAVASRTVYSLAFVLAASAGFALLSPEPASSRGLDPEPVQHARGGETLWIDGNLDGFGVAFRHEDHEQRNRGKASCVLCHHMNLPRDRNTGCDHCHSEMYRTTDAFRHEWHSSPAGGRVACWECHERGKPRSAVTAKPCVSCHKDLIPAGATIQVRQYRASGYAPALHQLCIGCHVTSGQKLGKPELARCANCHRERRQVVDAQALQFRERQLVGKRILLPAASKR